MLKVFVLLVLSGDGAHIAGGFPTMDRCVDQAAQIHAAFGFEKLETSCHPIARSIPKWMEAIDA